MTKFLTTLALVTSLLVSIASSASAQTTTPPAGDRTGTVTGQIANGTKGGKVPGDLVMMLHAWDENGETVMLDGKADASGAFRFETVPMKDGWMFAAMLSYNDVTFFSDGVEVQPGAKEIPLALAIYETSSDASQAWVSQYHTLLDFAPG
ncbi:MAG: hypothetical protein AAB382_09320, partial [Chloroflexota bacterium]